MKHYGDITKLSGYDLPVVDVITGGSPCQDLSVAGKRAGLSGERSGLFMEQIRIIKEMREKDGSTGRSGYMVRPRYMVWENVPGAFSSGNPKGSDFAAVIEEIIKICEPGADLRVSVPPTGWTKSGCYYSADGSWSIAWRVHDAQFWGVPQRRKRISLVADFGGHSAPEILFEREGLRGNPTESAKARKGTAGDFADCSGAAGERRNAYGLTTKGNGDAFLTEGKHTALSTGGGQAGQGYPATLILNDQGGDRMEISENVTGTLRAQDHGHPPIVMGAAGFCTEHSAKARGIGYEEGASPTLRAGVVPAAIVYGISSYDSNSMKSDNPHSGIYEAETARTLDLNGGNPACNQGGMVVVAIEGNGARPSHKGSGFSEDGVMYTLNATEQHGVSYVSIENHPQDSRIKVNEDGIVQTLDARMGMGGGNVPLVMDVGFFQSYEDKCGTLLARQYKDPPIMVQRRFSDVNVMETDVCPTIEAGAGEGGNNLPMVMQPIAIRDDATVKTTDDGTAYTLDTMHRAQAVTDGAIVRRLTPLECERLQGFPDYWTDIGDWVDSKGKKHKGDSDAPRYKALGNSISLPFWQFLARRICAQYERDITMGSLFDGIGGFPLAFEKCGAKAVWASEIEEFPIAVTKKHFPEEEDACQKSA